jgi:signal peptidase I
VSVASRALRVGASALGWAGVGLAVALAGVTTVPPLFGYPVLTVLTGSMDPTVQVGSAVIDGTIQAADARPGDIVTFPSPRDGTKLITHRVQRLTVKRGRAYFVTRGDANDTAERWNVRAGAEIGRVLFVIPRLGYARQWMAGLPGRVAALALVLLWGVSIVRRTWASAPARPQPEART